VATKETKKKDRIKTNLDFLSLCVCVCYVVVVVVAKNFDCFAAAFLGKKSLKNPTSTSPGNAID